MNQEVIVNIAPILHGLLSKLDVIGPEANAFSAIAYENQSPGHIFFVATQGFSFELQITDDSVILTRNGYQAIVSLAPKEKRNRVFILEILWSPIKLGLTIIDKEGTRDCTTETSPVFPPHKLREWTRREALVPVLDYESPYLLYEAVLEQLRQLRDKIVDTNAINGFWDIRYDGKKIEARKPKRETDIHPQIRLLLYDLELLKGLQITPEYNTGTGRLDFLISGRTQVGHIINVCLEFKLAHAADLAHGILVQLPEYMARRATDFGIYCVLDFGIEYPPDVTRFDIPGVDNKDKTLDFIMPLAESRTGRPYLKSVIFDLSRKTTPSKA